MLKRIGKYEIQAELGKGGFGKVYRAFDPTVGRQIAIKVLTSDGDETTASRFRAEASSAGNLKHKNIVTIHDFGDDQGVLYLVMEYLEGDDLSKVLLNSVDLSLAEKMRIMSQVAEGLHCAHMGGVVHRDVKPANIMLLKDGTVKIMDFGIARLTRDNSHRLTQSGFLVGTIAYMAPEQLTGMAADVQCDLWSYGTIYYELLTGRHPFFATDTAAVMFRITAANPGSVREFCPECPESLDAVIQRMLLKDRDARYQSLEDVLLDTAPILIELDKGQASQNLARAQNLVREQRLDEALTVLKGILQANPLDRDARTLREQINRHLQRRNTRVRYEKLREQAEQAAAGSKYEEAIEALQSAAKIDPNDSTLRQRIEDLERAKTHRQRSDRLLAQARSEFERRNLTEAVRNANEVLRTDPENAEARSLLASAQRSIGDRDADRKLKDGLSRAKGSMLVQAFSEALQTLEPLAREFPDNPQVHELLEQARQQHQEHEREQRLQEGIAAAKAALKREDFRAALERLEPLAREASGNTEVQELRNYAREQLQTRERAGKIRAVVQQTQAKLDAEDFPGALRLVDQGLADFPGDEELLQLRQAVYFARQEYKRRTAVEQALREARDLEQKARFDEAIARLDAALRDYPNETGLGNARSQLQQKKENDEKRRRAEAVEKAMAQAQQDLGRGDTRHATEVLQHATRQFPGEAHLAALLAQAQRDQEQQQLRREIQDALARAEELRQRGEHSAALSVIEVAQRQHPGDAELEQMAQRLRDRVALEADLSAIGRHISRKEWSAALALIATAKRRHGDHAELINLENQASTSQHQTELDRLCDEVQHLLSIGEYQDAKAKLDAGRERFAFEPRVLALDLEINRAWERRQALDNAAKFLKQARYDEAQATLNPLLVQDPNDREAWNLYERAQSNQQHEQSRAARDQGRNEAQQLLQQLRFDEAIERLRALASQYPDDSSLQGDFTAAVDAKTKHIHREAMAHGRSHAESLVRSHQFDAAIAHLEQLDRQFPNEQMIQADLRAARSAKADQDRREKYDRARQHANDLMRDRNFSGAHRALSQLLSEFPGDPALESALKSAEQAASLHAQQQRVDQEVEQLQKTYRKGDAATVRERAAALLGEIEDPRVRELYQWAENELSRKSNAALESTEALRRRNQQRRLVFAGIPVVLLAGVGVWYAAGRQGGGTASLSAQPKELSFAFRAGADSPAPQLIQVEGNPAGNQWTAASTDNWIAIQPAEGATPAQVTVSVDPTQLGQGSYSGLISLESASGGRLNVPVRLVIERESTQSQNTGEKSTKGEDGGKRGTENAKSNPPPDTKSKSGPVVEQTKQEATKQEQTKQEQAKQDPPKETKQVAVVKPEVLPPIVNCRASDYFGRERADMTWVGELEPNGVVTFTSNRGGPFKGTPLPSCDITVELVTPGAAIVEGPSEANHYSRVRVRNASSGVMSSIQLRWVVKR